MIVDVLSYLLIPQPTPHLTKNKKNKKQQHINYSLQTSLVIYTDTSVTWPVKALNALDLLFNK